MIELFLVGLLSIFVGYLIAYNIYNRGYSADGYVSRKLYSDLLSQIENKNKEIIELNTSIAKYSESIDNYKIRLEEEKKQVEKIYEKNKDQFENLANDILDKKSEKFINLNKSNIDQILKPLDENINKFKKTIEEKYEKELKGRSSLEEQIKHLTNLNNQISQDAINLTNALKGDSKTQGDWGEFQLEVLLENSGLRKNVNFEMRPSFKDESGKIKYPDCIVSLPGDKNFVIDSKVSLLAYEKLVNADNEDECKKYLKEHIDSIKQHINDLSDKSYQSLHNINPPDYVFMFVPIEAALYIALKEDLDLYNKALNKNIILVSVTTLLTTMRTVSFMWKQENQKNNVLEIARQSGALYDKFVNFIEDLNKIGESIARAHTNFNNAKNKLHEGRGNIINRIDSLKKLGAKAEKQLPKDLLEKSETNILEEIINKD